MGFNTVAFLLNDFGHQLIKSPHAVAHGLVYAPNFNDEKARQLWRRSIDSVARQHNEPELPHQGHEVLPTWHADGHKWFFAGGNMIQEMKWMRYGKTKEGKLTVTLELPEKWFDHPETRKRYR